MAFTRVIARALASTAVASISLVGTVALAEERPSSPADAQGQPGAAGDASTGLDEIIVTAQKRSENLQSVPATITALSSEALETRQINDIADLQSQVPSLVVGEYYGTSLVTLRGISTGITSGAEDPSVATHINGIYQPRSRSVDSAMADLERVEVLSGPQGTLYGRNATGGVVNYILKRPAKEFEGEFTARAGNYERYGAQARVTGPLSDNVAVLVSGIYDNQGKGYGKNLLPNAPRSRFDTTENIGGRLAVDIDLGVKIELDAVYLDTKTTPYATALGAPRDPVTQAFLGVQSFNPREVYSEQISSGHTTYFQGSAVITADLSDNFSLKSLTGYQDFRDDMFIDLDASRAASVPITQNLDSKTFTQELNLTGTWLDNRMSSVFGLFYYHDDFVGQALTKFSIPGFAADFQNYSGIVAESYAAFTDHTFSVSDDFRVLGGLRYNRDKKTASQSVSAGGFAFCPLQVNERTWESWTPRLGAQVDVAEGSMLYGQWSRGFKSGGFLSNSCADDFNPERITAFEAGIKTSLLDNRLRFNLAGYHYKISNLQVQKAVGVGGFQVDNAAAAKIYGAEFSLVALLSDNLKLDVAGMVQSAKYEDFQNCNEAAFFGACSSPATTTFTDVTGNWLNRAAPYSLNAGLEYTAAVAGGELMVRGETFFSGKVRFNEFNTAEASQPAYSTQNLFVTYTPTNGRFVLRAYVKNIANTDYLLSYFYMSATTQGQGNWSRPRTFGMEATVRF